MAKENRVPPASKQTFDSKTYLERVKRIFINARNSVGGIVLSGNAKSVHYVTGVGEGSAVLKPRSINIIAGQMQVGIASRSSFPVHTPGKGGLKSLYNKLLRGVTKVGFDGGTTSRNSYLALRRVLPKRKLVDVSGAMLLTALYKDEREIECLRKACAISAEVAREAPSMLKEGMSERELVTEINYSLAKKGGHGNSFGSLVGFGPNCAYPHAPTEDRKLKKGDFVMVDFGATVNHYGADITRTFVFGKASREQKEMYQAVLDALLFSFDMIHEGADVGAINQRISDFFESKGYGKFIHSVSHALGILGGGFRNEPNCVNTVEPGLYVPGVGGVRIEDDVLITRNGFEILTAIQGSSEDIGVTRELLEI